MAVSWVYKEAEIGAILGTIVSTLDLGLRSTTAARFSQLEGWAIGHVFKVVACVEGSQKRVRNFIRDLYGCHRFGFTVLESMSCGGMIC